MKKDLKKSAFLVVLLVLGLFVITALAVSENAAARVVTKYFTQGTCSNPSFGNTAVSPITISVTPNSQVCVLPPRDTASPTSYYYGVWAGNQANQHASSTLVCMSANGWTPSSGRCCKTITSSSLTLGRLDSNCRSASMSPGSGSVQYTANCNDVCTSGQRQCSSGTQYQVCGLDSLGECYVWGSPQTCPSGQTCSGGTCAASSRTLTVVKQGTGSGTVISDIPNNGINCGNDCTETYGATTDVHLVATASSGSAFDHWEGPSCQGSTSNTCTVLSVSSPKTIYAYFKISAANYNIQVTSTGSGSVGFNPSGTSCGNNCRTYSSGQTVTLTPQPSSGWTFGSWSGDCTGSPARTCTMNANKNVGVTFTCTPESNAAFCARNSWNCGTNLGYDNCGTYRQSTSCGTCTPPQTCSGGVCTTCTDECSPGMKRCDGNINQTCGEANDGDSCLEYLGSTNCPAGTTCYLGECCTNECTSGQKECGTGADAGKNRTCGNFDADRCLEWSAWTACPAGTTCSGGQCVLGPQTEYYWTDADNARITNADMEDSVKLVANTSKGTGVAVAFEIFDEDGISIRDDLPAETTDANGIAKAEWEISLDDMYEAGACLGGNEGEINFHFVASYDGRGTGDDGESGDLEVVMDCGEPPECISWYTDSEDEEDKQIAYCQDYELITGDDELRASQCNLDCNEAKSNELDNYLEQYPGDSITSYYCGWEDSDSTCNFYLQTGDGETRCEQSVEFGPCIGGHRTATYTYVKLSGPGPCPEEWTGSVICATSMEAVLPFFSAFNMIAAMSVIALIYVALLFGRELRK